MKSLDNLAIDTKLVHAGTGEDAFGSVVTPIYQTSTFKFRNADHGARLFKGEEDGYIYTRMRNPTVEALENCVAALEGGAKALACASGMAAVNTVFTAVLSAGDHVICGQAVYGPTATILETIFSRFGVRTTYVDSTDLDAVRNAVTPQTKLIHIETPGNPTLDISDLEAIAEIAHANSALLSVDNTFMGPVYQRPFEFGADIVIHSMTKFLNGHADVVAGVVVLKSAESYPSMRKVLNHLGGVLDPFNSFLVHRGIKTLKVRMDRQNETALEIARSLEKHPKVAWVRYPGLHSHPQYAVGVKQMSGFGAMLAFELKDGFEAGKTLINNVHICQLAVSLGGVESLIQHPASMTHAGMSSELRRQAGISDGLIRLSVGIEDSNDLLRDLESALALCPCKEPALPMVELETA